MKMFALIMALAAVSPPSVQDYLERVRVLRGQTPQPATIQDAFAFSWDLRAARYMRHGGPDFLKKPSGDDRMRRWIEKVNPTAAAPALLEEVARGFPTFTPSPVADFPKGTPPAKVQELRAMEHDEWILAVMIGINLSKNPLGPEALWHFWNSKDATPALRDKSFFYLGELDEAVDVLQWCARAAPSRIFDDRTRSRCVGMIGGTRTMKGAEALVAIVNAGGDAGRRRSAIGGLESIMMCVPRPSPQHSGAKAIAQKALTTWLLDPKLDPAIEKDVVMAHMAERRSNLESRLGPELEKEHPPAVKARIKRAIEAGGKDPLKGSAKGVDLGSGC
jgi:hypothetical protein